MREALSHHFDVVVVVWVLTLVVAWELIALGRADFTRAEWPGQTQHGPVWIVPSADIQP